MKESIPFGEGIGFKRNLLLMQELIMIVIDSLIGIDSRRGIPSWPFPLEGGKRNWDSRFLILRNGHRTSDNICYCVYECVVLFGHSL